LAETSHTPHILVVEDQPSTAEMLTSYFETQGYQVSTVSWGKDALAFTDKMIPDLIVLDVRLPDIDGYEVCRRLRARRRTERIPIIFLTEKREREDKLLGLQLGAVDYVTKPFDVYELRLRVRNVLRRSSTGRLSHPTTGLPAPPLSDARLQELLTRSDWTIISVGLLGLKQFSDIYGFVARDDVVRAVALMLNHVLREADDAEAFVGHLDDTNFLLVVAPEKAGQVEQSLTARLNEAMAFFYPRADWDARRAGAADEWPRLDVLVGVLHPPEVPFEGLEDFKRAVRQAQGARQSH